MHQNGTGLFNALNKIVTLDINELVHRIKIFFCDLRNFVKYDRNFVFYKAVFLVTTMYF